MSQLSAICGLHRSGTTFVGEILKQSGVCVVHEPLNEQFGMEGIPVAYPFVEKRSDPFSGLLDDAVHFARPWNKDASLLNAGSVRRGLYALTGGRSGLLWAWLRFARRTGWARDHICFKDPFMTLATPYLVGEHGLKMVCMIRHPAAIHQSTIRQGWNFRVENLRRQANLIQRYGQDTPLTHWQAAEESPAASIALLWKMMYRINTALSASDSRLLVIRHEDLCLEPMEVTRRILGHLGVAMTSVVEQFVVAHSEAGIAVPAGNKVHNFRRNSQDLVDEWRETIDTGDEKVIREMSGEDVVRCYGKW